VEPEVEAEPGAMNSAFSFMQKAELCFQLTDCDTTTANSQVTGIGDGDPTAFIPAPNGDPSSVTDSPMALRFSGGGELARSVTFAWRLQKKFSDHES
jgi:hypothetical protein